MTNRILRRLKVKKTITDKRGSAKQPERSCGTCQACCGPIFKIEGLKTETESCPHLAPKGCGIYSTRPDPCREFRCLWHYGMMRGELRPDRCGIIVTLTEPNAPYIHPDAGQALVIREVRPNASKTGEGSWYIQEMATTHLIIIIDGPNRRLLGPQHFVQYAQAQLLKHP